MNIEQLKAMLSCKCRMYEDAVRDLKEKLIVDGFVYKDIGNKQLEIGGKKWQIIEYPGRELIGYCRQRDYTTKEYFKIPQYWNYTIVGLMEV